ncbi:hypothetical protein AX16_010901 [Volvariella volvacea WC 439]|nr:hypothetical protein AX16_010901 [Volvariella volvacea WC 439]
MPSSSRFGPITLTFLFVISLFIVSSSAAVILAARDESIERRAPTFADSLPYRFTLTASNVNDPSFSGVALVLGQNGASSGVSSYVTSTYDTYPYNDYPSIGLSGSRLRAYRSDGTTRTNSTMSPLQNPITGITRTALSWYTTTIYATPGPQVFSALLSESGQPPLLAVYGDADNWSLCLGTGTRPQTNLYYNVPASGDCHRVRVNIIPI